MRNGTIITIITSELGTPSYKYRAYDFDVDTGKIVHTSLLAWYCRPNNAQWLSHSNKYKITNTHSITNTRDWLGQTQSRFIRDRLADTGQSVTVLYSTSFIFHNHLTPAPKKNTTSSTIHLLTIPVSIMFTQGRCSLGDQCKAPDGHLRPKYKCFFCSSNHYVKFKPNILHCNLLHCNFTYITL